MKCDKLIKIWAKVVKLMAGNRCEYPGCNNTEYLNAHHIIHRASNAVRYDPVNGMCLCPFHHTLGGCSAHKDPYFKDVIIKSGVRTAKFFRDLKIKSNQIIKQRDAQTYWRPILEKELERLQKS